MPTDKLGDALGMIITQITTLGTGTDVFFGWQLTNFILLTIGNSSERLISLILKDMKMKIT